MNISYFDDNRVTEKLLTNNQNKLKKYREKIEQAKKNNDNSISEYSLYHCMDFSLHEKLSEIKKKFKGVKHVVLIGIGGSSLGTEAIHSVLDEGKVKLSVLDTISSHKLNTLIKNLSSVKKAKDLAICVISKSGNTTETLANASVLLDTLETRFKDEIYNQTIFIGNPKTEMMVYGKKKGITLVDMPEIIGGRYSVATAVGLVPLTLLGHDVDDFIAGYLDASLEQHEKLVAESAARLAIYHQLKYPHYNFFVFEPRLEKLGRWYRQLFAESLGKERDLKGQVLKGAMVPTISTAVELHSVGQLYMSGVPNTLTDFVTFDNDVDDIKISKKSNLAKNLRGFDVEDISTALYGGVIAAYLEKQLPYRTTVFEESLPYSLGVFMSMRLREVMYTAELLQVNAFDQPNVELYKTKTKELLNS
jgi:glucose-6-phosphate isomerase